MKHSAYSRKKPARKVAKPVRKRPEGHGEKCLHAHCQQWLVKSGLWAKLLIFHVPNERRGGIGTGMHFKRMGVRSGVADYLLFANGRHVAIELKDDKGVQSKDQIKFQREWEATGGLYFVRRSLEEFQGTVHAFTLFQGAMLF